LKYGENMHGILIFILKHAQYTRISCYMALNTFSNFNLSSQLLFAVEYKQTIYAFSYKSDI
jgi:hypothetical protein